MFELPLERKYLLPPLSLACIASVLMLLQLGPMLDFDRNAINQGELWRILTGQFMHSNVYHLLLNVLGIVFIWLLHAEYTRPRQYAFNVLFLALWTGALIYFLAPNIVVYTGLSGLLHGVIIWGAAQDCRRNMVTGYLLFIGVWLKIGFEQSQGASVEVARLIESRVAIEAHLYGAVGGVILFIADLLYHQKRPA